VIKYRPKKKTSLKAKRSGEVGDAADTRTLEADFGLSL